MSWSGGSAPLGGAEREGPVPLDEFLDGNDDAGSWPQPPRHRGTQRVGRHLQALATPPGSVNVMLDVPEYPDTYPDGEFPYAPTAFLASDRPLAELDPAVAALGARAAVRGGAGAGAPPGTARRTARGLGQLRCRVVAIAAAAGRHGRAEKSCSGS